MDVFVNGRRVVANVVDLSVEQGWVDIEDPSVLRDDLDLGPTGVDPYVPAPVKLPTKRLYGKVEVKAGSEF